MAAPANGSSVNNNFFFSLLLNDFAFVATNSSFTTLFLQDPTLTVTNIAPNSPSYSLSVTATSSVLSNQVTCTT